MTGPLVLDPHKLFNRTESIFERDVGGKVVVSAKANLGYSS